MPSRSRSRSRGRTWGRRVGGRLRRRSATRSRSRVRARASGFASTTRWGRPYGGGYRARRIGVRRWRSIIWRDTAAKPHYRTLGSGFQPLSGPAVGTPNVCAIFMFPALQTVNNVFQPFHTLGSRFWDPGQVQDIDFGVTAPLFAGDITLRGGIARLTIGAYPENVGLRVRVYAVWANPNPDFSLYAAVNNTNKNVEFDPSLIPDFSTKFGRIMYSKQAMVPVGETFEIVHRFKPQKIDQAVFTGAPGPLTECAGSQLWWMVLVSSLEVNAISSNITTVNSYNLSFSADAIVP